MEKRRSKRRAVSLEARLLTRGSRYPAYIENICENGIHCITPSKKHVTSFVPEKTFTLNFEAPNGKKTDLKGEIRWVHINKTPIHGYTYRMGIEVLNHKSGYEEFLDNS